MAVGPTESILVMGLVFALGLCVGSFLNVLALRTLEGKSIVWPPSCCPACGQRIRAVDNIPLFSFLLLKGRCRWCRAPISWQYPLVELATAVSFLVLLKTFGATVYAVGMAVFVSTLIAVTITDFREKLIPHDITYPSMLVGIGFSTVVRNDLLGAMAGVGASYIIFDFIAHYGLKLYMLMQANRTAPEAAEADDDEAVDQALDVCQDQPAREMEEFEVMGGGDAVLSAVISAWLGWQRLVVALVIGFLIGTLMGVVYLVVEMRKANILHQCYRPAAAGAILGFVLFALPFLVLGLAMGLKATELPWLLMGLAGAAAGLVMGIVSVGTRVSKPFPFGPALAAGGVVAIFWNPAGALWQGGA
ncbi:MAG TPA: prepilin peptidase [Candidatus Obscuribacterales bacterium]